MPDRKERPNGAKWSADSRSIVMRCLRQKKEYVYWKIPSARFFAVVQLAPNPLSCHLAGSERRKTKRGKEGAVIAEGKGGWSQREDSKEIASVNILPLLLPLAEINQWQWQQGRGLVIGDKKLDQ